MSYIAMVKFYGRSEGGRLTPPMSGFKPHLRVGDEYTSCIITAKDTAKDIMDFGTEHIVIIDLLYPEIYKDKITEGMIVELYEGRKLIGSGYLTGGY